MRSSVICIGNCFASDDGAGLEVYENLRGRDSLPQGVDLVEGGICGLNLLPFLERGGRVVFVDSVQGFGRPGEVIVLDRKEIAENLPPDHFDHGAGLAYLLAVLPAVCEGEMAEEIFLVGLEGSCSTEMIERAADLSLRLASHGLRKHR